MTGAAFGGKLKDLGDYLPSKDHDENATGNAKLLAAMFRLQASGVPMKLERIERLH